MGKKVKCRECFHSMNWCLPVNVNNNNYDYAKCVYNAAHKFIVCAKTEKTKNINNEQYCRHYKNKKETNNEVDSIYARELEELGRKIKEFEDNKGEYKLC